ncbi:hypothetical protein GCM10009865_32210 [Aeromicrobium ponti]|uniref:MaoC dehydratase-like protein n=1 Tax=Cytobacillus oceanisediminis TaxID=665099 RepID=A0A562JRC4_9BACI|nr:hypothetical protein [Cytobacillus oceanisediminis]TWH85719.1 hypothetical protein IQ19_03144 [Cytobacillus oceanisediminis]
MMKEFSYDALSVGDVFTSKFIVTENLVENYCKSLGLGAGQSQPVPSSILAIYKPWYDAFGGRVAQGTIHLKQKMQYFHEVAAGDAFDVKVVVKAKYEKKGRDYLVHETSFFKGYHLYCRQTTTQLWAFAQKKGVGEKGEG